MTSAALLKTPNPPFAAMSTHSDRPHTNITIVIHPQGPGPIVRMHSDTCLQY